ncbi:MAG: dynamin family protein [Pseudomonadota bacterium]
MAVEQQAKDKFFDQIQAFGEWRKRLVESINSFQSWLEKTGLDDTSQSLRIYDLLQTLKQDRLTLAFVGEFSRGKTELINSIFFSHFKMRLLPSEAGRTTMCPTEIFYDDENPKPYLKLLPIETRLDDMSLSDYRKNLSEWTHIHLDHSSPENMVESFSQITQTKNVSVSEARRLGLNDAIKDDKGHEKNKDDIVEIPIWRQALINFPHPFLERGLSILDTPGLNSLGNEPELTLSMLPNAQAIVFVLSADTGVTRSDMDIWQQHLRNYRRKNNKTGLIIALNKIDTLWDDLKNSEQINQIIKKQCEKTAEILSVNKSQVIGVSAQKALLARIKDKPELLQQSNLLAIEKILAEKIIPQKEQLLKSTLLSDLKDIMLNDKHIIVDKFKVVKKRVDDLSAMSGRSADMVQKLLQKTRADQNLFQQNVENLKISKQKLITQKKQLFSIISLDKLDLLVTKTRDSMKGSWTTPGLKNAMKIFFDGIQTMIDETEKQVELSNRLIQSVYKRFSDDTGYSLLNAPEFDIKKHLDEVIKLHEEADDYRNSSLTAMTEQSFVIKNFFITLVSQARNIFFLLNREADEWHKTSLIPLSKQIKVHKTELSNRIEQLKQISESKQTIESQVKKVKKEALQYFTEVKELDQIIMVMNGNAKSVS